MDSLLQQARREPLWHRSKKVSLLLAVLVLLLLLFPLICPDSPAMTFQDCDITANMKIRIIRCR